MLDARTGSEYNIVPVMLGDDKSQTKTLRHALVKQKDEKRENLDDSVVDGGLSNDDDTPEICKFLIQ